MSITLFKAMKTKHNIQLPKGICADLSDKEFEQEYSEFSYEYDKLLSKSKGIMETSRTTLRALLGV